MCGITGICGQIDDRDIAWLHAASKLIKHRGPDSHGIWKSPERNAALGHRRLSIVDLSHANDQPFISDDRKLVLVFNGEIYNFREIRAELEGVGFSFTTKGDTEVLLAAYVYWGKECLRRLNGMWAFAVWDRRRGIGREQLFVSRDRAGEKPFYYRTYKGRFEFASELKGLKGPKTIDLQGLNHYLALGYVPGSLCIAEGIKKLPPAHAGLFDLENGTFRTWQYWELPVPLESNCKKINVDQVVDQAWSLLVDSVSLRLRSDVPNGVLLSGGLDSSLITAAAAKVSSKPIKTFTIGVPGSALDETEHAKLIADAFNTEHHVLKVEQSSIELLDELAKYIDEPIADASILPTFLVSRMTRQEVTVALGGDGGDEIYGGYKHYQNALRDNAYFGWIPHPFLGFTAKLASNFPLGIRGRNRISSLRGGPNESYIWGTPYFDLSSRKRLFSEDVLCELGDALDAPEQRSLALMKNWSDPIEALTRMDFQQMLPDDFLVKIDRASMANSLEIRTPFLDHRIVEHAFGEIPSNWKVTIGERRRIQNIMANRYLPKGFNSNRKQGFSVPTEAWMKRLKIDQLLSGDSEQLFNGNFVQNLLAGQCRGRSNTARLFSLLVLSYASL